MSEIHPYFADFALVLPTHEFDEDRICQYPVHQRDGYEVCVRRARQTYEHEARQN